MNPQPCILWMAQAGARHGSAIMLGGTLVGLACPALAASMRDALPLGLLLVNLGLFLQLDLDEPVFKQRRLGLMLAMLAWTLVASPLVAWSAAVVLQLSTQHQTAVLLYALAPTAGNAAALAALLGVGGSLVGMLRFAGCLFAPLLVPAGTAWLLPASTQIEPMAMVEPLALFVLLPAALAALLRRRRSARAQRLRGSALALVGLLIVGIGMMEGMSALWCGQPLAMAGILGLALATTCCLQGLGTLTFARCGAPLALCIGLACGHRNVSLVGAALVPQPAVESTLGAFFAMAVLASAALGWLTDIGLQLASKRTAARQHAVLCMDRPAAR